MKTTEIVDSIVRGKIAEMGYELDEVEYVKEYGNMNMAITPDTVLSSNITLLVLGDYKSLQKCFKL